MAEQIQNSGWIVNTAKQTLEFYDLSERLLNSGDAYWGNLGYWQSGDDYSAACEGLAHQLARAVNLNKNSRILDVGFGCGDQLLLWLKDYDVHSLSGINYSTSQTQLAQRRLHQLGYIKSSENIIQGDVAALNNSLTVKNHEINTVLALDCAYHFPCRRTFFTDSYEILKNSQKRLVDEASDASIGLTDIVLASSSLSWRKRLMLNIMLSLSQIPQKNIVTLAEYKNQLQQAGFDQVVSHDISESVFEPFGDWLRSQKTGALYLAGQRSARIKYKVTTAFLAWAYRNNVLRYVVISAKLSAKSLNL